MAEYRGRGQQQPGHQQLCLDAGRALLLGGALVITIPTAFDFSRANAVADSPAAASTTLAASVGFLLWIVGACLCLLALTPAAAPWAVRAGAAVASTVLKCLCPPVAVNY